MTINLEKLNKLRNKSIYIQILLFIIPLLCSFAPFLKGLYFEAYLLPFQIITYVIFILWGILKWFEKEKRILKTKIEYLILGLVTAYMLSIFTSVSFRDALSEGFKYLLYFVIFMLLSDFISNARYRDLVLKIFMLSYILASILGIDGALGGQVVSAINSLFDKLNINFAFTGLVVENRIGSVLQYPNAFAASLCAMLFVAISMYLKASKPSERLIYSSIAFVFLLTLFLTVSRGVFVIIPFVAVLYIIMLPKATRLEGFLLLFILTIVSAPVFLKVYGQITKGESSDILSWVYILSGVFAICILSLVMKQAVKLLAKINLKVSLFVLAGFIVFTIAAFIFVLKASEPLIVNTNNDRVTQSVRKRIILKPGNSYRLEVRVEASSGNKDKPAYYIEIANKNESQVVQSKETTLTRLNGATTVGPVYESLTFDVPKDSKMINIHFGSKASAAKVIFYSADLYDDSTNKLVKSITLKYKYIPQSIATRFEALKSADTGISRLVYYKDALSIIKDHGIIGAGGGAWATFYTAYQSIYYRTNDPHSYIFQLGIETGLVGVGMFLLLLAVTIYNIYERRKGKEYKNNGNIIVEAGVVAAIVAMVIHSCIDLDFSIPSVFLVFWMLMSILNGHKRHLNKNEVVTNVLHKMSFKQLVRHGVFQTVILLAICIAGISFSTRFIVSKNYIKESQKVALDKTREDKILYLKKAISADPYSPLPRIDYANTLVRTNGGSRDIILEAYNHMAKAEKLAYYNSEDMARIAAFYLAIGDAGRGLTAVDRSAALSPLWIDVWYQKAEAYQNVTLALFQKDQQDTAMKLVDKTLNIINEIKACNAKTVTPLMLDRGTKLILERMSYIKEYINVDKSINIDRIVFYSINSLDVNNNKSPDQWTQGSDFDLGYSNSDDTISISQTRGKATLVSAKPIVLEAGKRYNVDLELVDEEGVNAITMSIYGLSDNTMKMIKVGKSHSLEFEVPVGFKSNYNYFEINVDGDCKLKKLIITKL